MAAYNKFQVFVEDLAEKQHNLQADTLRVMLSNIAPVATNAAKGEIAEISAGGGYTAGGPQAAVSSSTQSAGTYKLVLADVVITATQGNTIGPLRYAVLYNATSNRLIGWWDYGASFTLASGESLTVDFDDAAGVLTLA